MAVAIDVCPQGGEAGCKCKLGVTNDRDVCVWRNCFGWRVQWVGLGFYCNRHAEYILSAATTATQRSNRRRLARGGDLVPRSGQRSQPTSLHSGQSPEQQRFLHWWRPHLRSLLQRWSQVKGLEQGRFLLVLPHSHALVTATMQEEHSPRWHRCWQRWPHAMSCAHVGNPSKEGCGGVAMCR